MDCQPRTKNGHPPQSTTGVVSASSIHPRALECAIDSNMGPGIISLIASKTAGIESAALTQNRRVMSVSSGLSSSSAVTVTGSSAMPQIGHEPGPHCRTSGCIGHVYSTSVRAGGSGVADG